MSDYSSNTIISLINELIGKYPKTAFSNFDFPLDILSGHLEDILNKLSTTLNVSVTDFPALENVKVTNTTSTKVLNFPSNQDVTIIENTLTPTSGSISTTSTSAVQLTSSSISANALILTNTDTSNTVYIGFDSSNQPYPLSPSGIFILEKDNKKFNLDTIYLKSSAGVHISYTYWA